MALFFVMALAPEASARSAYRVYIGTYTGGDSKGIYQLEMDAATGELESRGLAAETVQPSWLALHPKGKYLYAVNEVSEFDGKKTGALTAFAIDRKSGALRELNQKPSGGSTPCHLIVDKKGRNVLVANYGGGSVAVLPIAPDGSLKDPSSIINHRGSSVNQRRQEAPHAHGIYLDRSGQIAMVPDLGIDKVLLYAFNPEAGTLNAHVPDAIPIKAGSGPRHLTLHPRGDLLYVINELTCTLSGFQFRKEFQTLRPMPMVSTLPPDEPFKGGYSTAEVQVHPNGKFLYGSNRGHDTIVVYRLNRRTGEPILVEHESTGGKTPRSFGIDPRGRFLLAANQSTHSVVVFRIHSKTGALEPTGHEIKVPRPVCVVFQKL